jgi:hypothetical protein
MIKNKILITVEGGVIQHITGIPEGTEIEVQDFDKDGDTEHPSYNDELKCFQGFWNHNGEVPQSTDQEQVEKTTQVAGEQFLKARSYLTAKWQLQRFIDALTVFLKEQGFHVVKEPALFRVIMFRKDAKAWTQGYITQNPKYVDFTGPEVPKEIISGTIHSYLK